jgi:hypothetical protein
VFPIQSTVTGRRNLLKAGGLGLLLYQVDGAERWLSPREARGEAMPLSALSAVEVEILEALGETLVPGAREEGIAHFVDHHLGVPAEDSLLTLRYLDIPPPYAAFYRAGLAALDAASRKQHGKAFDELAPDAREALVAIMSHENPPGWKGPPAPLFYFALRSDAIDVVYGTVEGFDKLGIPYMPHIKPASRW